MKQIFTTKYFTAGSPARRDKPQSCARKFRPLLRVCLRDLPLRLRSLRVKPQGRGQGREPVERASSRLYLHFIPYFSISFKSGFIASAQI